MGAKQLIQAGFARGIVHRLDANGYPVGITGSLNNGEVAHAYELKGIKTADLAVPEPEKTNITGNNRFMGAFTWPINESPTGNIEAAVVDLTLNAALEGTKVMTRGGVDFGALGAKEASAKSVFFLFQSDAYSQETGYVGLSKKFGVLIPKASAVALGTTSITERNEINSRLSITIQMADKLPWGSGLSLDDIGATEALMLLLGSDYWIDVSVLKGNGTVTDIPLAYTPAGDHTASPQRVFVSVNGTDLTPTTEFTVDLVTPKVVLATAPAAGEMAVVWYEHE